MVVQYIERKLLEKSTHHRAALTQLEIDASAEPLSDKVFILDQTPQLRGMNTILQDIDTSAEDFIFYFDRLACLLVEKYAAACLQHAREKRLTILGRSTMSDSRSTTQRRPRATSTRVFRPRVRLRQCSCSVAAPRLRRRCTD